MSGTLRRVVITFAITFALAGGLSLVGSVVADAPAHAAPGGTAFANGTTLYLVSVPGKNNNAWVEMAGPDFRFEDAHEITPGTGCVASNHPNIVTCSPVGITKIQINTGDQNDTLGVRTTLDGGVSVFLYGGGGSDILFGHDGNETLYGGGGADTLKGGPGNDLIFGGADGDTMYGEHGIDTVSYADHGNVGVSADADGTAGDDGQLGEGDTIATDVENIVGTQGPDVLGGGAGTNALFGEGGNDMIVGSGGGDFLDGGAGFDTLYGDGGPGTSPYDVDVCVLGPDGGTPIACEVIR